MVYAGLESVPTGLCGGHGVGRVVGGQIRVPLEMADESEIEVPRSQWNYDTTQTRAR